MSDERNQICEFCDTISIISLEIAYAGLHGKITIRDGIATSLIRNSSERSHSVMRIRTSRINS